MLGVDLVTSSGSPDVSTLGAEDYSDCPLVFSWNATFPSRNHTVKSYRSREVERCAEHR